MKKERVIFILIILIILVGAVLLGGRENTYDKSKEKKQQTEQTVSRSEKNSRLCKIKKLPVHETRKTVKIPEQYRHQLTMLNGDSKYLYFSYSKKTDSDNGKWRTFKADRKTGKITKFQDISSSINTVMVGYNGDMYCGAMNEDDTEYQILRYTAKGHKVIYERCGVHDPETIVAGSKLVMIFSNDDNLGSTIEKLVVLDLDTVKTIVADTAEYKKAEGDFPLITGTWLTGLSCVQSTLTKDGFCYEKCDFNGESEYTLHAGRNKAYYYSFETGKKTELNTPDGALEYINGTPELYISSTQASADEDGGSADIFIKEKDKYREINLNSIVDVNVDGTILSCAMAGPDHIVFESSEEGFYIVGLESLKWYNGRFAGEDGNYPGAYDEFAGSFGDNDKKTYTFMTKDGNTYMLHTLSGR